MVSVHLELSDEVHTRLLAEAETRGMSLQRYMTHTLSQRPGAPHYAGLLDDQMEALDEAEDPLDILQEAYRHCVEILHHDMVSLQTELIGLQLEIVRRSLQTVQESGLTAEHYFYIAFRTDAPDVLLGEDLRAQHPETMTIVLEHQFSQLEVDDNGFSVSLWFGGVPRRIGIPFNALLAFVDPSSELQLTFPDLLPRRAPEASPEQIPAAEPAIAHADAAAHLVELQPAAVLDAASESIESIESPLDDSVVSDDAAAKAEGAPSADGEAAEDVDDSGAEASGNVLSFHAFRKK